MLRCFCKVLSRAWRIHFYSVGSTVQMISTPNLLIIVDRKSVRSYRSDAPAKAMAQHHVGSDFSEDLSDGTTCSCATNSVDKVITTLYWLFFSTKSVSRVFLVFFLS